MVSVGVPTPIVVEMESVVSVIVRVPVLEPLVEMTTVSEVADTFVLLTNDTPVTPLTVKRTRRALRGHPLMP